MEPVASAEVENSAGKESAPIVPFGRLPRIPSHEFQFLAVKFAFEENRARLERGYEESCALIRSLAQYELAHE